MRVVRRPAAVLAATCLALGALSACGDEGDGEESSSTTVSPIGRDSSTTSSSTSSSSSASSSSTKGDDKASELPAAAKKHTQEGATEFAKFYWLESSRAAHVGDTSFLKTLFAPACDPCQAYTDLVDKDIKKGLRTDILATNIKKSSVAAETDGKSDEAISLTATDAAYELVDDSGTSQGKTDSLNYKIIIYVDWEGGEWTVVDSYMIT